MSWNWICLCKCWVRPVLNTHCLLCAGTKGEDKWTYEVFARACSWLQ
jgi:hypothetical protein